MAWRDKARSEDPASPRNWQKFGLAVRANTLT